MRLSFKQIESITVGAMQIWENVEGVHFCKMTSVQLDAYSRIDSFIHRNANTSTGVRLDFWTDSPWVKFRPTVTGKYEVKVDGVLIDYRSAIADEDTLIDVSRDEKLHRVTIHLPCHDVIAGIKLLEIEDTCVVRPHEFARKFLFLGDSITQGWNSEIETLSYAYQVSDHFNAASVIQGVGGAFFDATTLDRGEFEPDTVFIAFGTNDARRFHSLDAIHLRCEDYINKVLKLFPEAQLYVITPIWCGDFDTIQLPYGHVREVNATIADAAHQFGITVIDGLQMIPHDMTYFADDLHPNTEGFCVYAQNLIKALENKK
jgi:lysophospholipase L1-like esterase